MTESEIKVLKDRIQAIINLPKGLSEDEWRWRVRLLTLDDDETYARLKPKLGDLHHIDIWHEGCLLVEEGKKRGVSKKDCMEFMEIIRQAHRDEFGS